MVLINVIQIALKCYFQNHLMFLAHLVQKCKNIMANINVGNAQSHGI